ncbi:MAG: exodeoxyribonuclease VII large subunit [Chloroflexi bacterium]|nr:exodeoxyribonuclease VII large subunit [Chloroflexota bacterium]
MDDEKVFSVREINTQVQSTIHQETLGKSFWVSGIVSDCHQSSRGHVYFKLEDDYWSIQCMISQAIQADMPFTVTNRMKLEVLGDIQVYDRAARLEIQVQQIRLIERSAVSNFLEIEETLRKKGVWKEEKKALPEKPKRIALVTSKYSNAVEDFIATYKDNISKKTPAEIFVMDVPIEGETAPIRIAEAIEKIHREQTADVIVITRGGGEYSTLAVYNDPIIAEAICRTDIPVISAVGHAKHEVFSDKIADIKANTPTDAALQIIKAQKKQGSCGLRAAAILFLMGSVSTSIFILETVQHLH